MRPRPCHGEFRGIGRRYCGKTRVAAGIVGHADLTLGSRVEPVLAAPPAHIAAIPFTNSVSPTGRISIGPESRYIEPASTNTVATMVETGVVQSDAAAARIESRIPATARF